MQTREQAEQNLGLGKKVNAQLEELKSLENRLNLKLDSFIQELEERRNLSLSVAHKHKIENIEQVENLNKLLSQHQEIKIKAEDKAIIQGFEGKIDKAIEKINKSLKVPYIGFYVWLTAVGMFFISGIMIWLSVQSKQEIITEYHKDLTKEKAIISKEEANTVRDLIQWLKLNPKTGAKFEDWRENQKNK